MTYFKVFVQDEQEINHYIKLISAKEVIFTPDSRMAKKMGARTAMKVASDVKLGLPPSWGVVKVIIEDNTPYAG